MPVFRSALACCLVAVVFAACGTDPPAEDGGKVAGDRLAVFSSQPLQGPDAPSAREIVNGEKLALAEAGGKVGRWEIEYRGLDGSTAAAGGWEPGQVSFNARKAAQDPLTIAYLGDLNGGAAAISIPILNEAGILAVSPWATNVGLTDGGAGADKGEPDKHYPSGERTFGRVIPNDRIQARALVELMRDEGARRLFVLHDREPYGRSLAAMVASGARTAGIEVVEVSGIDAEQEDFLAVATEVAESGADSVFAGMTPEDRASRLFADLSAANGHATLYGPGSLARAPFAAALPPSVDDVLITSPALPTAQLPGGARRFVRAYTRAYGEPPGPAAAFGYEAMAATLQAIRDAGAEGNDRQAVNDAFHALRRDGGPLGPYEIESDGDTTLSTYAVYRVDDRRLVFDRLIDPQD